MKPLDYADQIAKLDYNASDFRQQIEGTIKKALADVLCEAAALIDEADREDQIRFPTEAAQICRKQAAIYLPDTSIKQGSINPAKALRALLRDPEIKRSICERLGVPEDVEPDEESFRQAERVCADMLQGHCLIDQRKMSRAELTEEHDPVTCFMCCAVRE